MKKNKGFALSSILYGILILALALMVGTLGALANEKYRFDQLMKEIYATLVLDEQEETYSPWEYYYTGDYQTFVAPASAYYQFEAWGSQGGDGYSTYINTGYGTGGYGAYTAGNIYLEKGDIIYVYVGETGTDALTTKQTSTLISGSYNGGGGSAYRDNGNTYAHNAGTGGGATDFRLVAGEWNEAESLNSRIMIAAGGGGGSGHEGFSSGGSGGGLTSNNITNYASTSWGTAYGTNQIGTSSYYGTGYSATVTTSAIAGGGGYYGGLSGSWLPGTGGTSYISGHTGCVAITSETNMTALTGCTTGTTDNDCSIHYSNEIFFDTVMIDGYGYSWTNEKNLQELMPSKSSGYYLLGTGNVGNGYAKVTYLGNNV